LVRVAETLNRSLGGAPPRASAPGPGDGNRLDREPREPDPDTWYGLVWRIVRTAMESKENLIRMSILLILACAVLLLVAYVSGFRGPLRGRHAHIAVFDIEEPDALAWPHDRTAHQGHAVSPV
jgi:hypothetical protein